MEQGLASYFLEKDKENFNLVDKAAAFGDGAVQTGYDIFSYPGKLTNQVMHKTGLRNKKDYDATNKVFNNIIENRPGIPASWQKFLKDAGDRNPKTALAGEVVSVGKLFSALPKAFVKPSTQKKVGKKLMNASSSGAVIEGAIEPIIDAGQ